MSTSQPIVFYDIPGNTKFIPSKACSPNTWKIRFALNYKAIPYKTEWIEYPDIEGTFKELGIPPSSVWLDGVEYYSCPAIIDPSTNARVSDSAKIAEYLDKQYPDTPKLFPDGTHALQHAFYSLFESKLVALLPLTIPKIPERMNPESRPYLRRTREQYFGKTLEEMFPVGEAHIEAWAKVAEAFDTVDAWYEKGKGDGPYLLGKEPGFVDFVVVSWVMLMKYVYGEDSAEWQNVRSWNSGRWGLRVDRLEKWRSIH